MPSLSQIGQSIWSFISPRKTQERRDKKPFKADLKPLPQKPSAPVTPKNKSTASIYSYFYPTPPSESLDPDVPIESIEVDDTENHNGAGAEENAANNTRVAEQEKDEYVLYWNAQNAKVEKEIEGLRELLWPEEVIGVYRKISMRAHEPFFPPEWMNDFPGFSECMFVAKTEDAHICAVGGSDFRAMTAFKNFIDLGANLRDIISEGSPGTPRRRQPQNFIKNAIKTYHKWAMTDGKFDISKGGPDLPLVVFDSWPAGTEILTVHNHMQKEIDSLAAKWNALLRCGADDLSPSDSISIEPPTVADGTFSDKQYVIPPPVIYGVATLGTTCALFWYDLERPEEPITTVAVLSFGNPNYDFWSTMAVALFIVHIRDIMWDVRQDLIEKGLHKALEQEDPDA